MEDVVSDEAAGLACARPRSARWTGSLILAVNGTLVGYLVEPLASGNLRRTATEAVGSLWPW